MLEWYLNSTRYGRWIYGADAAAHVYFGKSATDLNLAEAAMLAAVAEAPALNPIDAPQAAIEHQRQVIQTMLVQGLITVDQAAQASQASLAIQPAVKPADAAPAFTNLVLEQLAARFPVDRLERPGAGRPERDHQPGLRSSIAVCLYRPGADRGGGKFAATGRLAGSAHR